MTDQDFERKEKARQDAMFDAQFADEPTFDVEYERIKHEPCLISNCRSVFAGYANATRPRS